MQNSVDEDFTERCAPANIVVDTERQSVGSKRIDCKVIFSGGMKIWLFSDHCVYPQDQTPDTMTTQLCYI